MRKCKITVYDYKNNMHLPLNKSTKPVRYDVEAWCVGGDEGIRAFFLINDMFCTANGDDGHWWLTDVCNKAWLKEIKEAINMVC